VKRKKDEERGVRSTTSKPFTKTKQGWQILVGKFKETKKRKVVLNLGKGPGYGGSGEKRHTVGVCKWEKQNLKTKKGQGEQKKNRLYARGNLLSLWVLVIPRKKNGTVQSTLETTKKRRVQQKICREVVGGGGDSKLREENIKLKERGKKRLGGAKGTMTTAKISYTATQKLMKKRRF